MAQYLEVKILGNKCYIAKDDLRICQCLAANIGPHEKDFSELPEQAYIVRVVLTRKKALGQQKEILRPSPKNLSVGSP